MYNIYIKAFRKYIYNPSQIEKVEKLERPTLLNKTNAVPRNVVLFSVTYSPTLLATLLALAYVKYQ